jgi:hypothetical protein
MANLSVMEVLGCTIVAIHVLNDCTTALKIGKRFGHEAP